MQEKFKELAFKLFDDDYGITEEAYESFLDLGESIGLTEFCYRLDQNIRKQDGRCFLPKDHDIVFVKTL